ncbi:MAG: YihY/virulence factor BrkB family protein [Alphaproteobacteria bacterium]|nr:YihY/virulence factor BrkB family protein [Alphaproteobacteria bacterium]
MARADRVSVPADHNRARPSPDGGQEAGRGRDADTPSEIPPRGWKDILWRLYDEFNKDRILAVAGGVTFYTLLALFPGIAAFVSLYALFADAGAIQGHLSGLAGILPGGAIDVISEQLKRISSKSSPSLGFGFVFGLALALWSANAGMKALFDALNVAYEEEESRGFIALNLRSFAFTLGAIALLFLTIGIVVGVPAALNYLGLGTATDWLVSVLRWPAILVIVVLLLAVLYRYAPNREKAQWRWITWGSALASVLWLIASLLFSWYTANFGKYNETYGSLGAVVGFMTWIWISVTVVLVGAELNAEMERQTARDTTTGPEKPLGQRRAAVADTVGKAKV